MVERIELRKEDLKLLSRLPIRTLKAWKKYGGYGFCNTNPKTRKQLSNELKRRLEVLS